MHQGFVLLLYEFLSFAVSMKLNVHFMDVENSLFNSQLDHELCMEQTEGFVDDVDPSCV